MELKFTDWKKTKIWNNSIRSQQPFLFSPADVLNSFNDLLTARANRLIAFFADFFANFFSRFCLLNHLPFTRSKSRVSVPFLFTQTSRTVLLSRCFFILRGCDRGQGPYFINDFDQHLIFQYAQAISFTNQSNLFIYVCIKNADLHCTNRSVRRE